MREITAATHWMTKEEIPHRADWALTKEYRRGTDTPRPACMSRNLVQRMRRLAELFQWGRRDAPRPKAISHKKRKGLFRRKNREQQQEEQREQVRQAQQAEQQPSVSGGSCVSGASSLTHRPSCSSFYDLEDEVFMGVETRSLNIPVIQAPSQDACHGDHNHDDHDDSEVTCSPPGPRRHSKTLPATMLQLPIIVVEGHQEQQQEERQQEDGAYRGLGHARHRSDSHVPVSQTRSPPSPSPSPQPQRLPEVMFDERIVQVTGGRLHSPFRATRKAPFTVKYTKVYGEADGAYKNDSRPRGLVFVCNFSKFKNNKHSQRIGSDKDYDNMVSLFSQMGYNPYHRRRRYCMTGSVTKKEFLQRLQEFAGEVKHKVLCSCVVILMSHGTGPRTFVTSDNLEVDLLDVYKIFDNINCPNLNGKPKIFILQFCRGQEAAAASVAVPREERLQKGVPARQAQQQVSDEMLQRMVRRQVSIIMRDYFTHNPALLDSHTSNTRLLQKIKEDSRIASVASITSVILEAEHSEDSDTSGAVGGESTCVGGASVASCTSSILEAEHSENSDSSATVSSDRVGLGVYEADTSVIPAMPAVGVQRYSDMYSIFSTSPGELSHRHPAKGSLLIQAICHVFAEYAYQDEIDTLVRRVSTYMTKTLQRDDPVSVPRQTCERTNNGLDKPFYFNPYEMDRNRQLTI